MLPLPQQMSNTIAVSGAQRRARASKGAAQPLKLVGVEMPAMHVWLKSVLCTIIFFLPPSILDPTNCCDVAIELGRRLKSPVANLAPRCAVVL